MAAKIAILDQDPAQAQPTDLARETRAAEHAVVFQAMEAAAKRVAKPPRGEMWHAVSLAALWGGMAALAAILVYLSYAAAGAAAAAIAGALCVLGIGGLGLAGVGMHMFSPLAFAAARRSAPPRGRAGRLSGVEMLDALGLGESVLDADPDAVLVTRRDGIVIYANAAYRDLAAAAGVGSPAGVPPRIDRVFAVQGGEATKLFRLCRAAKSAASADEVLRQPFGEDGARRAYDVALRPAPGSSEYVVWRLRRRSDEDDAGDALARAYADLPAPVFAVERSGQIAWVNAAFRDKLGAERGDMRQIADFVLGETSNLLRSLWCVDQAPLSARVRGRGGEAQEAVLTAFRRGGVGEGFVCAVLTLDEAPAAVDDDATLSGDVMEAPVGVAVVEGEIGRDARVVEANKTFAEAFGGAKKNAPLTRCLPVAAIDELAAEIRRKAPSGGAPRAVDCVSAEGQKAFAIYARPVRRRRGAYGVRRTLLYTVDVTDRMRMEADHAQDQKLKAIGRLAGEVAHDFNNVLQVVIGNTERLMLRHPAGDPSYQELVRVRENAQRAANLTKQLLALSRKQTMRQETVSMTEILRDFGDFLDRAVGEKVKIDYAHGRGLPLVRIDRGQFEAALMNLAVNARDAMAPNGGVLTIRTRLVPAEEMAERPINGLGGEDHLVVEVSDSGPGVPREIRDKIFDPFFTTKETGKGTGLGLATVYGVIGQMGGAIVLAEDVEKGATFRIYLPAAAAVEAAAEIAPAPAAASGRDLTGAGRILVVEDEDAVRTFVTNLLEDCGYEVTAAADGEEALEVLEDDAEFDLVISDVMMPLLDGPSFLKKAKAEGVAPAKVIFMSAYAEAAAREQLNEAPEAGYIQKPFTMKGLATKVKDTLADSQIAASTH